MSFCAISIPEKAIILFLLFKVSWLFPQAIDSSAVYRIGNISIKGNKKTKARIITREMSKQTGDTLLLSSVKAFVKRSQFNIFNTRLFIYDTIYPKIDHEKKIIDFDISVKERWYIWPIPILDVQDRNFNTWWRTKDLFRINYGIALGLDNFTGVKDRLVFIFQRGYSEKYGFSYRLPYLNKAQTLGFSMQYIYGRNNEVTYKTINNLPLFIRNYTRYMRTEQEGKVGLIYRPNLYEQTTLEAVVKTGAVNDTVVKLNPNYYGSDLRSIAFVSLQYRYTFDNRDNRIYPLNGWAFDAWINQDGFNFLPTSPINNLNATASLRKHTPLFKRFYLANLAKGRWMNVDRLSFNFNRALGWNDQVRGYEYYVIDGQSYFLTKNCLRYQLIKPHVYQNKGFLSIKQFSTIPYYAFISVFFDAAYVQDKFYYNTNYLNNCWQYGYGVGLDFITYYDLVLRLEYSFNKMKESGFFIHMTSGF
jgi:outer membrane protein assembly factor BamA